MEDSKDNVIKFPKSKRINVIADECVEEIDVMHDGDRVLGCPYCLCNGLTIRLDGSVFCSECYEYVGPINEIVDILAYGEE